MLSGNLSPTKLRWTFSGDHRKTTIDRHIYCHWQTSNHRFLATTFCKSLIVTFRLLLLRQLLSTNLWKKILTTIINQLSKKLFYVCHLPTFDNRFSTTIIHILLSPIFDNHRQPNFRRHLFMIVFKWLSSTHYMPPSIVTSYRFSATIIFGLLTVNFLVQFFRTM